jgi:WD repeat and SOF domain-containing protein 1
MPFPTFSSPGQRPTLRDKNRMSPLPSYSNIVQEKHQLTGRPSRWTTTLVLPLPGRRLPIVLPIPPRISQFVFNRFGPRKATTILIFGFLFFVCTLFAFGKRFGSGSKQWPQPFSDPPSLVFGREDLRKVWEWEIASGHYPSNRRSE